MTQSLDTVTEAEKMYFDEISNNRVAKEMSFAVSTHFLSWQIRIVNPAEVRITFDSAELLDLLPALV